MRELIVSLGIAFSAAAGLAQTPSSATPEPAARAAVMARAQAARGDWLSKSVANKGPVIMVTHPDFGYGQPVAGVAVDNVACTSAPKVDLPEPQYDQDGSHAVAIGYCVQGKVRVDISFPGGGYAPSQVATITGGGASGATGRLILLGTANPADPTGVNDSSAPIENAVDYAVRLGTAVEGYPAVRVPAGTYRVTEGIRVPTVIDFGGDSRASTTLNVGPGPQDLLFYYNAPSLTSYALGNFTGAVHDLVLQGPGHTHFGSLLTISNGIGLHFHDLSIQNSGGSGIHISGLSERLTFDDVFINDVRWPGYGGGNETHFHKLILWSPGVTDNNAYYYGPNAVGGVANGYVGGVFTGGSLEGLACDGRGHCTLTERGHNGVAPLPAGGWFQVSGVGDLTAANGVFQAAAVANNRPAAGEFQVTYDVVSSSNTVSPFYYDAGAHIKLRSPVTSRPSGESSGLAGASFTIAEFPVPYGSFNPNGEDYRFEDGSIKTVAFSGGIQAYQLGVGTFEGMYVEAAQPSLSSSFTNGGWQPFTYLSSSLSSASTCSGAAWCAVKDAADPAENWFPNYSSSTQYTDLTNMAGDMEIMPPDYNPAVSSPSAFVAGVNRNQFEVVQGVFAADGNLYIERRNLAGLGGVMTPISWPAGSIVGWVNATGTLTNGGSHVEVANNHLNSQYPLPKGWTAECNDNGPNICASMILGVSPDYVVTYPLGTPGQRTIGGAVTLDGYDLEGFCNDATHAGNDCIKVQGRGFVFEAGGAYQMSYTAAPAALANGVTQGNAGSYYTTKAGVIPIYYPSTGWYSSVSVVDNDSRAVVIAPQSKEPYNGWAEVMLQGQTGEGGQSTLPNGATPGYGFGYGHQYTTADCWYDTPSASQKTVNERFCFKGGPKFTGTDLGFEHDLWNPATQRWVTAFSCHADSADPTRDDCTVGGTLTAASYSGGTYTANVRPGLGVPAGSCKTLGVAVGGFPANLSGHGVVPVSVPNPTVVPGGLVALAPYGVTLTSTGANLVFCDSGSAPGNAPAGNYNFKVF
jgi:hypothetical protein